MRALVESEAIVLDTAPKAGERIRVAILPVEDRSEMACLSWIPYGFMFELRHRIGADGRFWLASNDRVFSALESVSHNSVETKSQAISQLLNVDVVVRLEVCRIEFGMEAICGIDGKMSGSSCVRLSSASADDLLDVISLHIPAVLLAEMRPPSATVSKHETASMEINVWTRG